MNLVHRLLKNHVAEKTGWRAYALFTAAGLDCMRVQPGGLVEGSEFYEHLGEVHTYVMDLHARYEALMQARRVVVEDEQAVVTFGDDFGAPPPVVWSWLNEPEKRRLDVDGSARSRVRSRFSPRWPHGAGATTHCIHGKSIAMRETVLDWKPFDYYTVEQDSGPHRRRAGHVPASGTGWRARDAPFMKVKAG